MDKIVICMGSSCFARENRENLEIIEGFLSSRNLSRKVRVEGTLCMGKCGDGPNVAIDGIHYGKVMPSALLDILAKHANQE